MELMHITGHIITLFLRIDKFYLIIELHGVYARVRERERMLARVHFQQQFAPSHAHTWSICPSALNYIIIRVKKASLRINYAVLNSLEHQIHLQMMPQKRLERLGSPLNVQPFWHEPEPH